MGYYVITEPEELPRERIEYLMRRAGERFHTEFPGSENILMELNADTCTVRAWVGDDSRIYTFAELL